MNKVRCMIVALVVAAGAALVATPSVAQQKGGRASPHDDVYTKIGGKLVTIYYGRPNAKGRQIWGTLVPYGKAWRAGADEATTLVTQAPIMVGDKEVPAGAYTLYMVPEEKGTTKLAISKNIGAWGIPVNEKNDLARVDMKKESLNLKLEQFTITFEKGAAWPDAENGMGNHGVFGADRAREEVIDLLCDAIRSNRMNAVTTNLQYFSFPGSAWERTAREALPRASTVHRGRASKAVRSQAEPGNENDV